MIQTHTDSDTAHYFQIHAESGDVLLTSASFIDASQMEVVIQQIKAETLTENRFERCTNTAGKFLFNVHDENGNTIGHSDLYDSEAGMENGIKNLRGSI